MKCMNEDGKFCDNRTCTKCGFNADEAERRKTLPLTLCEDGLRRKIIGVKNEA